MSAEFPIEESYICPYGVKGDNTYCYRGVPFVPYSSPIGKMSRPCKAWDCECNICVLCD